MLTQSSPVAPPIASDRTLLNFSQTIQNNLLALFQAAHNHQRISVAPKKNDGTIGDISIFDDGTNIYLYIKTSRGWAKSPAFTLI
jgi:hypothetical protein